MTDDLTPEQDAVRRLLAEARHDGATPPEVVARLDDALAALVAERDTPETAAPVVDFGARRRRRVGAGLLAAAAVVVGGVAVGQVLPSLQGSDGESSSVSTADNGSTAREFGGAEDDAGSDSGAGSGSGSAEERNADSELASPEAKSEAASPLAVAPTVSTADSDLADDLLALREESRRSSLSGPAATDASCELRGIGRGRRVAVEVDGQPGVVVFRRPSGDVQEVAIYVCGNPEPVRAEVLPAP
jgi:hypothetical protein